MVNKIYITGGSGFVGTQLCQRLADHQVKFIIIDINKSQKFPENTRIADIRILDELHLSTFDMQPGDTIIHLAAVHRDDIRNKSLYYDTNVTGTRNICETASARGEEKIVFTSSVAVYGFAPIGTDERGEINPFNEYGRTKHMAELVLGEWQDGDADRSALIVRPTVIFGPGNRGNVYNLLNQISSGKFMMIGSGHNKKSMAYVENVAAFLHHSTMTDGRGVVVNYTDGPDLNMNDLVSMVRGELRNKNSTGLRMPYILGLAFGYVADMVAKITGRRFPISSIRVKKFCADSSFSSSKSKVNGFVAPVSLKDGLTTTLRSEFVNPDPNREIFYTE